MANKLTKVDTQNLLQQERTELDGQIAAFIERNRGNAYEINRLTFDATMILTSADKHSKEKAAQKFFERFRKNITGAKNSTQDAINQELTQAQYAAQKILVKLAEQQQLSFEVISFVHNKLNAGLLNVNKEINDIYIYLLNIDERVEKLEKNFELLTWATTIKNQKYCGTKYRDLGCVGKNHDVTRNFLQRDVASSGYVPRRCDFRCALRIPNCFSSGRQAEKITVTCLNLPTAPRVETLC